MTNIGYTRGKIIARIVCRKSLNPFTLIPVQSVRIPTFKTWFYQLQINYTRASLQHLFIQNQHAILRQPVSMPLHQLSILLSTLRLLLLQRLLFPK
jgi:hypothetical protein